MNAIIDYIKAFLLNDDVELASQVGYSSQREEFANYRVVIYPSGFFQSPHYLTPESLPVGPLEEIEEVPFLFGKPNIEHVDATLVIHADIIASSYFLLSRYEELVSPNTSFDEHGRFRGKTSLLGRNGLLMRPLVDEYGLLLRQWLRLAGMQNVSIKQRITHINLTHDVDKIAQYRHIRGLLGGIKRSLFNKEEHLGAIYGACKRLEQDPSYTFPWLFAQNGRLKKAQTICFFKAMKHGARLDYPIYNVFGQDMQQLLALCEEQQVTIGLHASYASGTLSERIIDEQALLSQATGRDITANRHHYLRAPSPDYPNALSDAYITDDYTMGYADIAGFRLGTSRAVRWIDPQRRHLTHVILHPLTVMDCTLSNACYMNLTREEAFSYVKKLIDQTAKYGGELGLLWHNTSVQVATDDYHRVLYELIISYLKESGY